MTKKEIKEIPNEIAEKTKKVADTATSAEIEVKKTTRKTARKAKNEAEEVAKDAVDTAIVAELEVNKAVRKTGRRTKETAAKAAGSLKEAAKKGHASAKKAAGIPNIIIQSPMGGIITPADITKMVPKGAVGVYVRVDENKLYYVLKDGNTGDLDIWE